MIPQKRININLERRPHSPLFIWWGLSFFCENNYDGESEYNSDYDDLKLDNDDDFCRLREIVRFVKKDDAIWTC